MPPVSACSIRTSKSSVLRICTQRTKKVAPKAAAGKTKAASKGSKRARDHEEQNKDEGNESINGARKSKKSRISEVSTVTTGQSEPERAEVSALVALG